MTRDGGPPQYIGSGFFATPEIFITETVATDTIGVIFIKMIEGACYGSEVFSCSPATTPHYIQGVCNGEGATPEISSPIFGLNWLFLGGPTPPCRKACDSDGNGDVNITDMVHLLNFLFLGGFPPSLWGGPNPICSAVAPGDDCEIPNSACPLPRSLSPSRCLLFSAAGPLPPGILCCFEKGPDPTFVRRGWFSRSPPNDIPSKGSREES